MSATSPYGLLLLALAAAELFLLLANVNTPKSSTLFVSLSGLAAGTFDNLLIGLGALIGTGPLLETLSTIRYVLHAIVVPLLLVPAAQLYAPGWLSAAWVLALLLMAYELRQLFPISWNPRWFRGTLRLVNSNDEGPPIVTIAVNVFLVIVAFLLFRKSGNAVLLLGSGAGLILNALPSNKFGTFPGALGEAILFGSILLAQRQLASVPGYL